MARRSEKKGPAANRLRAAAEPNRLSWTAADTRAGEPDIRELGTDEANLEEADLEEADLEEAEYGEDEPEDMTADLDAQAEDYLAGNDVWMYGPNAEAVMEILDELEEIGPDRARPIAEAWTGIARTDRDRVRKIVRKIYETDAEANRHLQLAREAVATWMAVAAGYPDHVKSEPDWPRLCSQAGEAAMDAATAVILEETLSEDDFDALYGPWSDTMDQLDAEAEAGEKSQAAGDSGTEDAAGTEEDEEEEDDQEFGPNSDAVADFLNRLWLLTPEQVGRLVSTWQNLPRGELKQAHTALAALVEQDGEYRDEVRRAQEKLAPWLNATRLSETAGFLGQAGQGESRKMAGPALADAVAALVLGDLLAVEDADLLYRPWFNLIGAPPLPEPAEEEPGSEVADGTSAADVEAEEEDDAPSGAEDQVDRAAPTGPGGSAKTADAGRRAPEPGRNKGR